MALVKSLALIRAARTGHSEIVAKLLSDSDQASKNLSLIEAAGGGYTSVVEMLLDSGVAVNARDSMRSTALIEAARFGNTSTAKVLLTRGANPRLRNKAGFTAEDWARQRYDRELLDLLRAAKQNSRSTGSKPD
jgi:ankyrin repeat protein